MNDRGYLTESACGIEKRPAGTGLFLKGPIPLAWLQRACRQKGSAVAAGVYLWHLYGLNRGKPFGVTLRKVSTFMGASLDTARRSVVALEDAGLINVERKSGQKLWVTVVIGENKPLDLEDSWDPEAGDRKPWQEQVGNNREN